MAQPPALPTRLAGVVASPLSSSNSTYPTQDYPQKHSLPAPAASPCLRQQTGGWRRRRGPGPRWQSPAETQQAQHVVRGAEGLRQRLRGITGRASAGDGLCSTQRPVLPAHTCCLCKQGPVLQASKSGCPSGHPRSPNPKPPCLVGRVKERQVGAGLDRFQNALPLLGGGVHACKVGRRRILTLVPKAGDA